MRVTETQLLAFLDICYDKYYRALIEPGKSRLYTAEIALVD